MSQEIEVSLPLLVVGSWEWASYVPLHPCPVILYLLGPDTEDWRRRERDPVLSLPGPLGRSNLQGSALLGLRL